LSLLAAKAEIAIVDAKVEVTIDFGRDPVDGLFNLVAQVRVHLPGVEPGIAEELVRNTERFCRTRRWRARDRQRGRTRAAEWPAKL